MTSLLGPKKNKKKQPANKQLNITALNFFYKSGSLDAKKYKRVIKLTNFNMSIKQKLHYQQFSSQSTLNKLFLIAYLFCTKVKIRH